MLTTVFSDWICGSEPCYNMSKTNRQICIPLFNKTTENFGEQIYDELNFTKIFGALSRELIVICIVIVVAIASTIRLLLDYSRHSTREDMVQTRWSNHANLVGDSLSVIFFLALWLGMSWQAFNKQSFCVMNPNQFVCKDIKNRKGVQLLTITIQLCI